jgi:5-methylcytosine-specific restriction endonuclease McrA
MSPIRLCLEAGCASPATSRGRCDFHRKQLEADRSRRRRKEGNAARDYRVKVHHSAMWKGVRRAVLERDPFCTRCDRRLSEHVHHVVAITDGGAPYDLDNCVGLCAPCHNRISWQEQQARREGESSDV